MTTGQDDYTAAISERLPPFSKHLGIRIVSATPDLVVAEMEVRPEFCTTPPTIHGGAVMAFADTLGAVATIINLREGQGTTTLESKTNFVAPAPAGDVMRGETTPVHRGRRTQVWQTRITNGAGKLVAIVTQTQMVL